jgi:hypothetical protein
MWFPIVALVVPPPLVAQSFNWRAPAEWPFQSTANDLQLTLRVRRSILQDDRLAQHLIGVTVQEQVATLWGNVPSGDESQRAELRTRSVIGVAGVRNELHITPALDRDELVTMQPPIPSRGRPSDSGTTLLQRLDLFPNDRRGETERPEDPAASLWRPARTERSIPLPGDAIGQRVSEAGPSMAGSISAGPRNGAGHQGIASLKRASPPDAPANESLAIMPPIQVRQPPNPGQEKPRAVLSSASKLQELDPLSRSIEALRCGDPRFLTIRYKIADGVVYLIDNSDAAARFAFAQAVSQLPGAKRVILEDPPK